MKIPRIVSKLAMEETNLHGDDVKQYLAGNLSEDMFKARRVPRGIYGQRQDGKYMVRVRIAGGILWADQARKLAHLSQHYGNGTVHLTTRGDIQLHEVAIDNTPKILESLLEVGLSPLGGGGNTTRNITACGHSGLKQNEIFDTLPYALAVTDYLLQDKSSLNLPRKLKVAFSGCLEDCALATINDLGFVATIKDGQAGFRVYVGGGLGVISRPADLFLEFIPASDCIRMTEAVKRMFLKYGNRRNSHRARLRFAVESLGTNKFHRLLKEEYHQVVQQGVPEAVPVDIPKPHAPKANPSHKQTDQEFGHWSKMIVHPQKQSGLFYAHILVKKGDLTGADLENISHLAELYAGGELRVDRLQNLLLPHIPQDYLPDVYNGLKSLSQDVMGQTAEPWMVACKGAATCRLGICRAQELNQAISEEVQRAELTSSILSEVEIHSSGCPNNCGQHSMAPLGFYGAVRRKGDHNYPCYNIVVGGHKDESGFHLAEDVGQLPARHIPIFAVKLLSAYECSAHHSQGFLAFWKHEGQKLAQILMESLGEIPEYDQSPEFYQDFGSDQDFSLAGRGMGECGAGVFELISTQLKEAEKAFQSAQEIEDNMASAQGLLNALTTGAGALLVTKGIDSGQPDTVLREFEKHFMDKNLVDDQYRGLLILARSVIHGVSQEVLLQRQKEIRSFLDVVQALYDSLDASLNFPVKGMSELTEEPLEEVNLRGVECPMNFVHAKIALEKIGVGQILKIFLDQGAPADNVPASFTYQGQEVLSIERASDGAAAVLVRRKK